MADKKISDFSAINFADLANTDVMVFQTDVGATNAYKKVTKTQFVAGVDARIAAAAATGTGSLVRATAPTITDAVLAESLTKTPVAISATAIDAAAGSVFYKTLAANSTFTFSNHQVAGRIITVYLKNAGTSYTAGFTGVDRWLGGGTPSQSANSQDCYVFEYIDGEWVGSQTPGAPSALTVGTGGTGATTAYGAKTNFATARQDIASAATTDLGTLTSDNARITGTTTITSLGSSAPTGLPYRIVFGGALTFTHNATSLILPNNGSNITTAAGDTCLAVHDGSGNWRIYDYTKANGAALQGGAGSGDFSSNTSSSVDGETVRFSGTAGKTGKRSTLTGIVRENSGVGSALTGSFGDRLVSDGTAGSEAFAAHHNFGGFFDDFLSSASPAGFGDTVWNASTSGGGISFGNGEAGRPGVIELETTTSSSGAPSISKNSTGILFGGGKHVLRGAINLPNLSDGTETFTVKIGFMDGGTPVDGAWLEYTHGTNSGNWQGKTASNSVVSTRNGTIAAATGWTTWEIVIAADGSSVDFYINGVAIGAALTTDIPTGAGRYTGIRLGITKSAGTTNREMWVDYVTYTFKPTVAR
jgi:hypothetical protein